MVGTLITGWILDMDYRRVKASHEAEASRLDPETGRDQGKSHDVTQPDFPLERARLRLVPAFSIIQCISLTAFG